MRKPVEAGSIEELIDLFDKLYRDKPLTFVTKSKRTGKLVKMVLFYDYKDIPN